MMIKDILTHHVEWKEVKDYTKIQNPAFFELSALKRAISDHIEEYKYRCSNNYMDCIRGIKPNIGVFNIYTVGLFIKKQKVAPISMNY